MIVWLSERTFRSVGEDDLFVKWERRDRTTKKARLNQSKVITIAFVALLVEGFDRFYDDYVQETFLYPCFVSCRLQFAWKLQPVYTTGQLPFLQWKIPRWCFLATVFIGIRQPNALIDTVVLKYDLVLECFRGLRFPMGYFFLSLSLSLHISRFPLYYRAFVLSCLFFACLCM